MDKCYITRTMFLSLSQIFHKVALNMVVQCNLEIFKIIKPKIELGITIATFHFTNEPFWQRILIKTSFMATVLCFVSSIVHIENTFERQLTGNLAMSIMFCFGSAQIISKSNLMWYHQKNILELLDKVQSLHNDFENDEINSIGEKTLTKFSNIWGTCFK